MTAFLFIKRSSGTQYSERTLQYRVQDRHGPEIGLELRYLCPVKSTYDTTSVSSW